MNITNHKASRQLMKRENREGNRYTRQLNQRREGPNVRIRQGSTTSGFTYVRLRDGSIVKQS